MIGVPTPPRAPVLDWTSFAGSIRSTLPSVDQAPNSLLTTSGRAAIYQALKSLGLPAGRGVLVPTYHCPTMVAPVVQAGLEPLFFGLSDDALPQLDAIPTALSTRASAMVVAHYFGHARSLAAVRAWCDVRAIALIEDCAHCFFGQAGERQVGHWGDFATASLTKFFPVSEAGLLVSTGRAVNEIGLVGQGLRLQIKGWVDILEQAHQSERLAGLNSALGALLALKGRDGAAPCPQNDALVATGVKGVSGLDDMAQALADCDMARADARPLAVARHLFAALPRQRIVTRRQAHHRQLRKALTGAPGAHPLFDGEATGAPYALPLWVDDADRVYQGLRQQGMPVFRWDRVWPGTPVLPDDCGASWRHHVLQLVCHQDLRAEEVGKMAKVLLSLLRGQA